MIRDNKTPLKGPLLSSRNFMSELFSTTFFSDCAKDDRTTVGRRLASKN